MSKVLAEEIKEYSLVSVVTGISEKGPNSMKKDSKEILEKPF